MCLTVDGGQDDAGVVVGDDVGVTIFGLVHLQVGMFPGELLAWIDRLTGGGGKQDRQNKHTPIRKSEERWEELSNNNKTRMLSKK